MKLRRSFPFDWRNPITLVWFVLWHCIEDQQKRMCVMASLYARLAESETDNVQELNAFNEAMGLSRDTHALRFPALFAPLLWKTVKPVKNMDLTHLDQYIGRLLKKTPCWLIYGDLETRREDVRRLVEYCRGQTLQVSRMS